MGWGRLAKADLPRLRPHEPSESDMAYRQPFGPGVVKYPSPRSEGALPPVDGLIDRPACGGSGRSQRLAQCRSLATSSAASPICSSNTTETCLHSRCQRSRAVLRAATGAISNTACLRRPGRGVSSTYVPWMGSSSSGKRRRYRYGPLAEGPMARPDRQREVAVPAFSPRAPQPSASTAPAPPRADPPVARVGRSAGRFVRRAR